jgi:small-conductance mechanosensitive channel
MGQFLETVREAIAQWWVDLSERAPQVLIVLLILAGGLWFSGVIKGLVSRGLRYRRADPEFSVVLARILQWGVITLGILVAAQQAGLDITAFLTGLGILGFTVGFALQDVSKNFIAGMLILVQQPFQLGDTIEVAGFTGTILEINLRDTEMRTSDGLRVRIPNGDVFTSPILNYTGLLKRRIQLSVGVAYDSDLDSVRIVALKALKSLPGVLDDPAIDLRFESFGDYAIQLSIYYWYDESQTGYSDALDGGIRAVKAAFDAAHIEIPVTLQNININRSQVTGID